MNYEIEGHGMADSSVVSAVMKKVYFKMFVALLVSAAAAFAVVSSPAMLNLIYGSRAVFFVLILVEVGMVLWLSARLMKMSQATATLLFYLYSFLNGVTLSAILLAYTMSSISYTFMITAGVFGTMSVYGYVTKSDLSKFGSIMVMALFGLIICSVVNLFMHSSTMDWIISFAGVAIFIGLTAWDTQKIKQMVLMSGDAEMTGKLATIGALTLYLDFVNLFLYLLRFFGKSND